MRIMLAAATLATFALAACQKAEAPGGGATTTDAAGAPVTPALTPAAPPSPAAAAANALGQATDSTGELRMEVTEAVRAGGVLTVKTRMTLIGGKPGSRPLPGSNTADVYLTAADKKYLLLEDDHDKALMSSEVYPGFEQVGATSTWWGKFPAPAPEVRAVNFYFHGFEPVENVAITDR